MLGVDSVLCFVSKLNSPAPEDGPDNVLSVTSQVSLLGRKGETGESQELANQAEKLTESLPGSQGNIEKGSTQRKTS